MLSWRCRCTVCTSFFVAFAHGGCVRRSLCTCSSHLVELADAAAAAVFTPAPDPLVLEDNAAITAKNITLAPRPRVLAQHLGLAELLGCWGIGRCSISRCLWWAIWHTAIPHRVFTLPYRQLQGAVRGGASIYPPNSCPQRPHPNHLRGQTSLSASALLVSSVSRLPSQSPYVSSRRACVDKSSSSSLHDVLLLNTRRADFWIRILRVEFSLLSSCFLPRALVRHSSVKRVVFDNVSHGFVSHLRCRSDRWRLLSPFSQEVLCEWLTDYCSKMNPQNPLYISKNHLYISRYIERERETYTVYIHT